jgi:hypothetical protein
MRATRINGRWVWTVDGQDPLDAIITEVTAASFLAGCVNLSLPEFLSSFMLAGKTGAAKSSIMFQLLHALLGFGRCKYLRVVNLGTWRGLKDMTAQPTPGWTRAVTAVSIRLYQALRKRLLPGF